MSNNIRHFEDESVTLLERIEILAIMVGYFKKRSKTEGGKLVLKEIFPQFIDLKQLEIDLNLFTSVINCSYNTLAKDYEANTKLLSAFIKNMQLNCTTIAFNNSSDLYDIVLEKTRISILKKRINRSNYNPTKLSPNFTKISVPLRWVNNTKKKLIFPPFSLS